MPVEGFREYQIKLLEIVRPFILSTLETDREEFREIVRNTLLDEDGLRTFSSSFTRRDEIVTRRLFLDFEEITSSYLCLRDIEIYIKQFPYDDTEISPLRHLRYHIGNYLNEIYIFGERLEAYLSFLQRRYRKSPISQAVHDMTENLAELISDSLSNVIDIRGSHVHSHRYTDEDLRRLSLLQNLSDDEEGEAFLEAYRLIYRETRDTWSKRITSNNDATEQLLDICSQRLYSTLFAEDGQFVFPDDR